MSQTRSIPGQPGYFCDAEGRIWSSKSGALRLMKLFTRGRQGHLGVNLTHNGKYRMHSVHRLVALTWIGVPPSPLHLVMHLDDAPTNNRPSNLAYGLPRENSLQMVERGRQARGEAIGISKLSRSSVRQIRARVAGGEMQRALAMEFGVSPQTVTDIKNKRIWKD